VAESLIEHMRRFAFSEGEEKSRHGREKSPLAAFTKSAGKAAGRMICLHLPIK